MSIGENVKKIREDKGIKQSELAERVGVTQSMMSQIERGSKVPSMPLGAELAKVLECSMDDLYRG